MSDPIALVRDFCAAWSKGNIDELIDYFTDDAVYHNIPVAPVTGRDAIRSTIEMFTTGVARMDFGVEHIVGAGTVGWPGGVDGFATPATPIVQLWMGELEVRVGETAVGSA